MKKLQGSSASPQGKHPSIRYQYFSSIQLIYRKLGNAIVCTENGPQPFCFLQPISSRTQSPQHRRTTPILSLTKHRHQKQSGVHETSRVCFPHCARVAESADATDSKSVARKGVRVQVPPRAPQPTRQNTPLPATSLRQEQRHPLFGPSLPLRKVLVRPVPGRRNIRHGGTQRHTDTWKNGGKPPSGWSCEKTVAATPAPSTPQPARKPAPRRFGAIQLLDTGIPGPPPPRSHRRHHPPHLRPHHRKSRPASHQRHGQPPSPPPPKPVVAPIQWIPD